MAHVHDPDVAHERAHGRIAHHLTKRSKLIAHGVWHGRGGEPGTHAPMMTHLWYVGSGRFIADHDYHLTTPRQNHQESHGAETAREIYDGLSEHDAPFPKVGLK